MQSLILLCLTSLALVCARSAVKTHKGEASYVKIADGYSASASASARQVKLMDLLKRFMQETHINDLTERGRMDSTGDADVATAETVEAGVTEEQQEEILIFHNSLRASVKPAPTNMETMYWSVELAAKAQAWAETCTIGHDSQDERQIAEWGTTTVGQNMFFCSPNFVDWSNGIQAWFDEVYDPGFVYGTLTDQTGTGHYTQMVLDRSSLVGCGYQNNCPGSWPNVYVCNYANSQITSNSNTVPDDLSNPYDEGSQCGACPNNCVDGLCDCGGKICLNNGFLDVDGCSCSCSSGWSGDICDTVATSSSDSNTACRRGRTGC